MLITESREEEKQDEEQVEGETEENKRIELSVLHLHLPLLQCERAWSYAMQLKQEYESDGVENGKRYRHMLQRLSKAVKWALELNTLCEKHCDSSTVLESQAYYTFVQATYFVEKDELEKALAPLSLCKQLLDNLLQLVSSESAEGSNTITAGKELLLKRKEHVEFAYLYCTRYLSQEGFDAAQLEELETHGEFSLGSGKLKKISEDLLKKKVQQAKESEGKEGFSVTYAGKVIPVRSEELALVLLKVDKVEDGIKEQSSKVLWKVVDETESGWKKLEAKYLEAFSAVDEAVSRVSQIVKQLKSKQPMAAESGLSSMSAAQLTSLIGYLRFKKSTQAKRKNLLFLRRSILIAESKEPKKVKALKAENIVRLCDRVSQQITANREAEGDGASPETDSLYQLELLEVEAYKAYSLARLFQEQADSLVMSGKATEKNADGDTLYLQEGSTLLAKAAMLYGACLDRASKYLNLATSSSEDVGKPVMEDIKQAARQQRCFCMGKKGLLKEQVEEGSEEQLSSSKDFEPKMKALPAKPFFFDLVLEKLRPENLDLKAILSSTSQMKSPVKKKHQSPAVKKSTGAVSPVKSKEEKGWFGGWFDKN